MKISELRTTVEVWRKTTNTSDGIGGRQPTWTLHLERKANVKAQTTRDAYRRDTNYPETTFVFTFRSPVDIASTDHLKVGTDAYVIVGEPITSEKDKRRWVVITAVKGQPV